MVPRLTVLSPHLLLEAYALGIFPMAEARDDPHIFWVNPEHRGILPLPGLHISRSLARKIRKQPFKISFDKDFAGVLNGCADREATWINAEICRTFIDLHRGGHAHSIEVWDDAELVGGIYGLSIGGAFFGESMFSRRTDASKIALAYLCSRLIGCGFRLFDTQFTTGHLLSMGAQEIDRDTYHARLNHALRLPGRFDAQLAVETPSEVLQRNTQTS
ncbi:leucyl/phenylalanyl-tRNA--protein transferase [Brevirhabdus sp.]|uniref:leucyl/phenylalanyl-tRNA--protein transferase n=1 Tax=Brevirhabdus sp. TaxID=2004514 RepID=UPI00405A1F37